MKSGDLVALYQDCFRLSIAISNTNVVVFNSHKKLHLEVLDYICNYLSRNKNFSSLNYPSEEIKKNEYEIYKTNIFLASENNGKTVHELIYFLKINLSKIQHYEEGDILKMPGLKIFGSPLYNHHIIYSGNVY